MAFSTRQALRYGAKREITNRIADMNIDELHKQSISTIFDSLRQHKASCRELAEYCIDRHDGIGSKLNAYKQWDPKLILDAADAADREFSNDTINGPLQGIPVSIKDIYGVPGYPIFAGSKRELPRQWQNPGPVVRELQKQLSVITGKTHTVEFAYGGLGVNNNWGTPVNPWDPAAHRVPGGSSSGAGVSLCEGSALAAFGTDTAGSVRIPASYTGNVGLKSSYGLWSTAGIVPLSPYLDTAGVLTRTVRDAVHVFGAMDSKIRDIDELHRFTDYIAQMRDSRFTIGLHTGIMWDSATKSIADVCMNAIDALGKDGCSVIPIEFPDAEHAIEIRNEGGSTSVELIEFLQSELPGWIDVLDPVIRDRIKIGGDISAVELLKRFRKIEYAREYVLRHFDDCDVIVSPTVPISPPLLNEVSNPDDYMPANLLALQNTGVASYLNLCAISVPVGIDELGLPVGLQFIGPPDSESLLLAIGRRMESLVEKPTLNL